MEQWILLSLMVALLLSFSGIMFKHILKINTKKIPAFLTIYYLFFGIIGIFLLVKGNHTFSPINFLYLSSKGLTAKH